ncbi:hypothetical protein H0E87_015916 [Populus deltoides]|uniref:Uncharacterized protein n=1 Tax=Populus deltoides TaxID=3696 RepID=A0A8T2Y6W0_POPDE|nr:hypothetical protein H0E87_015916 [Populus deltoides]
MKHIPFFGTKFGTTGSRTVGGDSKYYKIADHEKVDDLGLKDKEGSFVVDPSLELPSFDESEEEKHKKQEDDPEVDGRENLCKYEEDSWQILVPKSCTKKEEHKTESIAPPVTNLMMLMNDSARFLKIVDLLVSLDP